jgi:hypothetical protein
MRYDGGRHPGNDSPCIQPTRSPPIVTKPASSSKPAGGPRLGSCRLGPELGGAGVAVANQTCGPEHVQDRGREEILATWQIEGKHMGRDGTGALEKELLTIRPRCWPRPARPTGIAHLCYFFRLCPVRGGRPGIGNRPSIFQWLPVAPPVVPGHLQLVSSWQDCFEHHVPPMLIVIPVRTYRVSDGSVSICGRSPSTRFQSRDRPSPRGSGRWEDMWVPMGRHVVWVHCSTAGCTRI